MVQGYVAITFRDILEDGDNDSGSFRRIIMNNLASFKFRKGFLTGYEEPHEHKYMEVLKPKPKNASFIVTLDIEAYGDAFGTLIPYAAGIYNGTDCILFYSTDYPSWEDMLLALVRTFLSPSYHGAKVYIHNLSRFDGTYLLRVLIRIGKLSLTYRDGSILRILLETHVDGKHHSFLIFDSLLLLPSSLAKLGVSFGTEVTKGIFPYSFVKQDNLLYWGDVPGFSYFNCSEGQYREYVESFSGVWDMRDQTFIYLKADLVCLHQVLVIFGNGIFDSYGVDFTYSTTIASLALRVFRTQYLGANLIPLTVGRVYKDIRLAYYGGIVDVYKPMGENLFYYDVNSLYPASMLLDMPIGQAFYYERDYIKLEDTFGFYFAVVTAPEGLDIPVLPFKGEKGTFCPGGSFSGWYFSEELKEAKNRYGYNIIVLRGYGYKRGKIFNGYVDHFYDIKRNKKGPEKAIAKLMLNSLYGKFGMKPVLTEVSFVVGEEAISKALKLGKVVDRLTINGDVEMIFNEVDLTEKDDVFGSLNVSVGLSAAIAAYSRITINRFKHIKGNPCFYTDTDSVVLQRPLSADLVGDGIGLMKLEYGSIVQGVFLSPKVYGLKLGNGDEVVKIKGLNKVVEYYKLLGLLFLGAILKNIRVL